MTGPLGRLRVVELAGIGPGPFAGMLLADMGADVVRVTRPGDTPLIDTAVADPLLRGRTTVQADLKTPEGRDAVIALAADADVLLEGFRPGVLERLGLGPGVLHEANPRLVLGRMTGYGQEGPLADTPGHDINYIAIAGVLDGFRRRGERPMPPLNLVADFGGGGMLLVVGVLAAVLHARATGTGQVVDAAMTDGAALLATMQHGFFAGGAWEPEPGTNALDGGAHFYDVYETSDERFMAVGAVEPQFYAELLALLELPAADHPQWDRDRWPALREAFAALFRTRTQAQWTALFDGTQACVTPVLGMFDAHRHPHHVARESFVTDSGAVVPAPAPRFSATPSGVRAARTADLDEVRGRWAGVAA